MHNGNTPQDPNDNKEQDDAKKIIRFPALDERARRDDEKRIADKQQAKADKEREAKEKLWREQYRAQEAKKRAAQARGQSNGKTPFVNWDKIPPFSRYIVGICLLIQLYASFMLGDAGRLNLFYMYGFTPGAFTGATSFTPIAVITPITSLFIHTGWIHLAMNMFMLLAMSVFFERNFGTKRCVIFFFACGLCGDLLYMAMMPFTLAPVIGASGAISGLFAVNMMVMSQNGMLGARSQDPHATTKFLLLWVMIIIVTGLIFGGMAWQAHLGGFLSGAGLYTLWKKGKINL